MVGAEGSSSTKSEQKKTITNQLRYTNIIKKDLQIQIFSYDILNIIIEDINIVIDNQIS